MIGFRKIKMCNQDHAGDEDPLPTVAECIYLYNG